VFDPPLVSSLIAATFGKRLLYGKLSVSGTTGSKYMECPNCGNRESAVKDSRSAKTTIRRRRQCQSCHHRWTTIEAAIDDTASTTQQELVAKLAKIKELSEQISNLKIQNSVLGAENRAYSQPTVTNHYNDRPHLLFVLGKGSGPPYRIGVTRNADKIRNQYSKPTVSGLKLLYQKRQDRGVYARTTKQQVYDHFRENGVIGEWIKAPLGEVISAIDNVTDRIRKLFPETDEISDGD
jgi:hypothetical protein